MNTEALSEQREENRPDKDPRTGRLLPGNKIGNRFKPGQSGNPGGRPKDPGITAVQIKMLDKPCPYAKNPKKTTWREWLAERGLILAADKAQALEDLKNRLEGRVAFKIASEDGPARIIFEIVDKRAEAQEKA